MLSAALLALAAISLVPTSGAGSQPGTWATAVFKLKLKPGKVVPPVKGLVAVARGHVTFDLTRNLDADPDIDSAEAIFYLNYDFPGSVAISALHVHKGDKKTVGDAVISSGLSLDCANAAAVAAATDTDGDGNVTMVVGPVTTAADTNPVTFDLGTFQEILDNPKGYYAELHTCANPTGALREQLKRPKRF